MTDETQLPTRQAIAAMDRSAPLKVTGKLKVAIDNMVWKGARRATAAKQAGMTDHSLRAALKKPHVKAAYLSELQVLRESERARNILTMIEVRDGKGHSNPMARLNAAKTLEGLDDVLPAGSLDPRQQPGICIVIHQPASQAPMIEVRDVTRQGPPASKAPR